MPYDVWSEKGFIVTTEGNLTDVRFIADAIIEINNTFDLVELAYDDAWSSELIRMLGEAGFPMQKFVSFPQSHIKMNGPCQEWTRKTLRGEFSHDADPVMLASQQLALEHAVGHKVHKARQGFEERKD